MGPADPFVSVGLLQWFGRTRICRHDPWPDHVMRSANNLSEDVYTTMQGPEWKVTGNLKDWDVTERLGELALPALVTSGRYDEMSEAVVSPLVAGRGAGPLPRRPHHLPRPRRGESRLICPTRCHEPPRTPPARKLTLSETSPS